MKFFTIENRYTPMDGCFFKKALLSDVIVLFECSKIKEVCGDIRTFVEDALNIDWNDEKLIDTFLKSAYDFIRESGVEFVINKGYAWMLESKIKRSLNL